MTRATIFKHYSKALAEATRRPDVQVTTLPRPTEAGNPDLRVWNRADRITGYIEAKSPSFSY